MRRLDKTEEPDVLVEHWSEWTDAYVTAQGTPAEQRAERWRHDDIKAALRAETSNRCAYCESLIEDVSFPHVEHIAPKSLFPERAHEWPNLTWACSRCNNGKGAYFSETAAILNPYVDDPSQHLRFLGGLVLPELNDERAVITVTLLDLNRAHLAQARNSRVVRVREAVEQWAQATGDLKNALAIGIRRDALEGEYTRSVHAMLQEFTFPVEAPGISNAAA